MFNPDKQVDNINTLYTNPDSPYHIHFNKHQRDYKTLCHPDMNWVYNKCMLASKRFREMIEENHQVELPIDEITQKNPVKFGFLKNTAVNDLPYLVNVDNALMGTLQNYCCSLYYDECRKFQEENLTTDRFVPKKVDLTGTSFE